MPNCYNGLMVNNNNFYCKRMYCSSIKSVGSCLDMGLNVVLLVGGLAAEGADPAAQRRVPVHTLRDLVVQT